MDIDFAYSHCFFNFLLLIFEGKEKINAMIYTYNVVSLTKIVQGRLVNKLLGFNTIVKEASPAVDSIAFCC